MNDKKICFIVCANNQEYVDEQIAYLNALSVPDGYELEVLTIWEAASMTAGYNEGMNSTDAKYKVYMHQDVFIVNKNFVVDMLRVFSDETVGMLGVVGTPILPENCVMWNWADARVGRVYFNGNYQSGESIQNEIKGLYQEVEAVDGLLMATQYDIPFREDLFDGWDFYDISQCQEFRRSGYKVVVPKQEEAWCIHDDGCFNLKDYYTYRRRFVEEYKK